MSYPDYLGAVLLLLGSGVIALAVYKFYHTPQRKLMRQIKWEQKEFMAGRLSVNEIRAMHLFDPIPEPPRPFRARRPIGAENN